MHLVRKRSNYSPNSKTKTDEPLQNDWNDCNEELGIARQQVGTSNNDDKTWSQVMFNRINSSLLRISNTLPETIMVVALGTTIILLTRVYMSSSWNTYYDGPPRDLHIHGKRDEYVPVPKGNRRLFNVEKKGRTTIARAFHNRHWSDADIDDAHLVYRSQGGKHPLYGTLKPWQRYSRIPGIATFESKDGFLDGFRRHQKNVPSKSLYFLPQTYRLSDASDRKAFHTNLYHLGGLDRPWVLKKVNENNGKGIEMLGPNTEALKTAISRSQDDNTTVYIVQEYICNELVWFHGEKFDLRMYWMVVSIDPIIVVYHDGYTRVGGAVYDETDFTSTEQHLTNHAFRTKEQSEVTKDFLWKLIRDHYKKNYHQLKSKIKIDPVRHVRAQMKEALATTVSAFKDVSFGADTKRANVTAENLWAFLGADFVIDNDLDVWYLEAQASPGFGESYDYRVDMFNTMFRPMVDIVEEISLKQETDPKGNILPIKSLAQWEIIYAGDWQYTYDGYKRSDKKKSCSVSSTGSKSARVRSAMVVKTTNETI